MITIDELIYEREQARIARNWWLCDMLRNHLDRSLVFIFDGTKGQEIYYLTEKYFVKKPPELTNRQYLEIRIKKEIQAEKLLAAWLFTVNSQRR